MSTREIPPAPGLTRENTGYPHDVYRGWFLTRAAVRRLEKRLAATAPAPPGNVTLTAICPDCQALFEVIPAIPSTFCVRCRGKRAERADRRRR